MAGIRFDIVPVRSAGAYRTLWNDDTTVGGEIRGNRVINVLNRFVEIASFLSSKIA